MTSAKKLSTYIDRYPKKYLWLLAVAIGTLARIAVASLGHNDDFNFWLRHAEVVRNGGNLYEGVEFYGYGPIWMYLLRFADLIQSIFPENSNYESDGDRKIRIKFPLRQSSEVSRYSQAIVLIFDKLVIDSYAKAESNLEINKLELYGNSLRRIILVSLKNYDANGPLDLAHRIEVDDRALDL